MTILEEKLYRQHSNHKFQRLFRAKPWQGQKPEDADIIFLALDANYSADVDVDLIEPYHEDGVSFWKLHNVHHPFLTEQYTILIQTGKDFIRLLPEWDWIQILLIICLL